MRSWPASSWSLAMLAEMIFGVFLAMLTLILLAFVVGQAAAAQGADGRRAGACPRASAEAGRAGLVAGVLYAPLLVPILREMRAGYELAGWGDAEKLSVDLLGLVTPTALHPLGGDWVDTLAPGAGGDGALCRREHRLPGLGSAWRWPWWAASLYRKRLAAWITGAARLCRPLPGTAAADQRPVSLRPRWAGDHRAAALSPAALPAGGQGQPGAQPFQRRADAGAGGVGGASGPIGCLPSLPGSWGHGAEGVGAAAACFRAARRPARSSSIGRCRCP